MNKSTIAVQVEVTTETRPTRKGGTMQVCYVDLGGKYPEQISVYAGNSSDDRSRAPGFYVCKRLKKDGYNIVLDLDDLQPVTSTKAA